MPAAPPTPAGAPPASYRDLLAAYLERYKKYPADARKRGEQGVVLVRFTIDRQGNPVAEPHIERGSGFAALDNEVLALIRRAAPLPPFPPSMDRSSLDLTVPVQFHLQ